MNYKEEIKKLQARLDELEKKSCETDKPQHEKITLEEFLQGGNLVAINCDTKEKFEELSKGFKELGLDDFSDTVLRSNWINEKRTYCIKCLKFATKEECEGLEIPVFEFDDVIMPREPAKNEPRWSFTDDEKTILRNVPERLKWLARDRSGSLWVYGSKPNKCGTAWSDDVSTEIPKVFFGDKLGVFQHIFQCIKWSDDEPCEFRKFL